VEEDRLQTGKVTCPRPQSQGQSQN
jgi:hypothetical protein